MRFITTPHVLDRRAICFALCASLSLVVPAQPAHAQGQAATEQATSTGLLRVSCPQRGAQVFVDNQLVGEAPISEYIAVGTHTVRVVVDNYDPFVRRVVIKDSQKVSLNAQLVAGGGTVEFATSPSSGTVVIDERDRWPLPIRITDLSPGTHRYTLESPGHEPVSGELEFRPGKNIFIFEELRNSAGLVAVTSRPEGASVMLDGQLIGTTPLMAEDVLPGEHSIRIDLDGYASIFRTFDNSDGLKAEVSARMNKKGGNLMVKTGNPAAVVSLDGTEIGTGSAVKLKHVKRGRYLVRITTPEGESVEGRVEIPDSGSATYKARYGAGSAKDRSELVMIPPFYKRWTFWTATAIGTGGAVVGTVAFVNATTPQPIPVGDVNVPLP